SSYPSLPGSSDDVVISITNGTWIITHNSGIHSVKSLQCNEIFNLGGGTFSISSYSQCPSGFLFSGGTFGGVSSLTMGGSGYWTAGNIGTASYTNGLINDGAWEISGTGAKTLVSALTNNGTMTQNGSIDIKNGGVLVNNTGKTYEIKSDVSLTNSAGTATVDNRGTFRKSTTGGTTDIYPVFNDAGTLDVATGTLRLWGGGNFTGGTVSCNSTANGIFFEGGTFTMGECSIGGFGKGAMDNATFQVPTGNNCSISLNNGFALNSGILTGTGGQIFNYGTMDWYSAAISGLNNLRNESTLRIYGTNSHTFQNSQLGNYGTIYHMGSGNLTFSQSSQFHNISGDYLLYSDASFASSDGTGVFINNNVLKKAYSSGTSRIETQLTNSGSIEVDTGTLALSGGGTFNGGAVSVAYPSYFTFSQGQYTINGELSFGGSGYVSMAGGAVNYSLGAKTSYSMLDGLLYLTGTNFSGQGTLVNYGKASWQTGTFSGGAHLENRGTLSLASYTPKNLQGAEFDNVKDVLQIGSSGPTLDSTSVMNCNDTSSYEFQADSGISGTGVITNGGVFRKTYSTGESLITPTFNNQYGVFDIDTGTIKLAGGGTWYDGGANVMAGAALTLATGTFTLNGDFQAGGSGNMNFLSGTVNLAAGAQASFILEQGLHLSGATINGPGSIINNWNADWSTGTLASSARFTNNSTFTLTGTGTKTLRASTLYNPQTTKHTGIGALDFKENSTLDNAGLYQLLADASLTCTDGGSSISNGGTFQKYSSSGVSTIQPLFTNHGLIDAHSGTLRLSGGSDLYDSTAGIYSGARLDFTGGNHHVRGRFAASGAGSSTLASNMIVDLGATAEFNLDGGFHFVDGYISGAGSVVNKGQADWTNGLIVENGTIMNYGTLAILEGRDRGLRRGHLITLGTVNHQQDSLDVDEKSTLEIAASGTYNLMNDRSITGYGPIKNDGILRKYSGTRESTVANPINSIGTVESASGTLILNGAVTQVSGSILTGGTWVVDNDCALEIASSDYLLTNRATVVLSANSSFRQIDRMYINEGTFRLLGGRGFTCSKQFNNVGTLELGGGDFSCGKILNTGTWRGSGIIIGGITNRGTVEPTAGNACIAMTSGYIQDDTGTLKVTLTGYEDELYGKIVTAGTATLAGTLRIDLAAGFTPVTGQKFLIVDASARSGQFKTLTLPTLSGGLTFNPIYTSFGLALVVGSPMIGVEELPSVVDARTHALNTCVSFPAIVSAVFSDNTFFVQDENRIAGMKIVCTDQAPVVGQKIQVAGLLYSDSQCLSLTSSQWVAYSWNTIEPPKPLFVTQKYLGGSTLGQQNGVMNGLGLNNVGLLVRTAGTVTCVQQYKFAYIDDGSRITDGNTLASGGKPVNGVRVIFPPNTTISSGAARAMVTGICCRYYINGYPQRAILVRSRDDIATY
ncbi:MAG: beta strand repeat-containing protein, partial [Armatimonadota bacterium]